LVRSGEIDNGEFLFSSLAGGRSWSVECRLKISLVDFVCNVSCSERDCKRVWFNVGDGVGVVERVRFVILSANSVSEEVAERFGERIGCVGSNSSCLKWLSIDGFLATVVGPIDTCCCFRCFLVCVESVNKAFSFELGVIVVE
jgi:hypothetical protein